jgi:hypothetical protein
MGVPIFIKPSYLFASFTKIIKLAPHCSHSHTIAPLHSLCMIWPFAIGFKPVSFTRIEPLLSFTSHKPLLCDKSPWLMALLNLPQIFSYSIHSINYFLPFETFQTSTSMIILLRETIQCGNADCNLDKQVSLSSPSFATLIFQFPGTPYALRNSEKIAHNLSFNNSSCYVEGSYRYMHFLATLSKIKLYLELVIHTIHAAFPPPQMISVSLVQIPILELVLFCATFYTSWQFAIAFILYHMMSIHLQNFK